MGCPPADRRLRRLLRRPLVADRRGRVGEVDVGGLVTVLVVSYDDDEPGSPWSVVLHVDERRGRADSTRRSRRSSSASWAGRARLRGCRGCASLGMSSACGSSRIELVARGEGLRAPRRHVDLAAGDAAGGRRDVAVALRHPTATTASVSSSYAGEFVVEDEPFSWELRRELRVRDRLRATRPSLTGRGARCSGTSYAEDTAPGTKDRLSGDRRHADRLRWCQTTGR